MSFRVIKLVNPSDGDRVSLPEDIGRTDVGRFGPTHRPQADGYLGIGVVGTGDQTDYVVLTEKGAGEHDVPPKAQVLGFDVTRDVLVYAVPVSEYGGGA